MTTKTTANLTEFITPWVAYTPVFTGFGTPTDVDFYSRRVGDTLEVHGKFTVGTSTAVQARIELGFNGTSGNVDVEADKLPDVVIVGTCSLSVVGQSGMYVLAQGNLGDIGYCTFSLQNGSYASNFPFNGNALSAGTVITCNFKVPIAGW